MAEADPFSFDSHLPSWGSGLRLPPEVYRILDHFGNSAVK
jgi:hypothetical protein